MKTKFNSENLKLRAFLNSVTTLIDFGARLAVSFFVTPLILNGLGSILYGAWKVLPQIVGYGNLIVINSTESLKWTIAKDRNQMDSKKLRSYVTSTIVVLCLNIPLLVILSSFLTWYSPIIIGVDLEYFILVRVAAAVLFLDLITRKLFSLAEAVLRGMNIGFKGIGVRSLIIITTGFLQYLVLYLNYGIVALAIVQLVSTIMIGLIVFSIVRKNVDWFGFGKFDKTIALIILKQGGWYSLYGGIEMTIENSDKILLSYLLGPVFVTKYVITEFLIKSVQGIINNITLGVMPGMSLLVGEQRITSFTNNRKLVMNLTWIMIASFGAVIIALNESFISMWVGSQNFAGQSVNILILITIGQYLFIKNDGILISSILKVNKISSIGLFSAMISIILSYFLIKWLGLIGLLIGMILGRGIISIYYPLTLKKILNTTDKYNYITPSILATTILIWATSLVLSNFIIVSNWVFLILYTILLLCVALTFLFFLGLKYSDRSAMYVFALKLKNDISSSIKAKNNIK